MKLIDAVEQVLEENPRTKDNKYLWDFFVKVLNKMGHRSHIEFSRAMPSPESIITERRRILNNPKFKDKYGKTRGEFVGEEGVTYKKPQENLE